MPFMVSGSLMMMNLIMISIFIPSTKKLADFRIEWLKFKLKKND